MTAPMTDARLDEISALSDAAPVPRGEPNDDWFELGKAYGQRVRALRELTSEVRRARAAEAEARTDAERYRQDHADACARIVAMHEAAVGNPDGPVLGVVEDVAAVRAEVEKLRAENAEREQDAATAWRHSSAVDERVREAMQEITRSFERLVDRLNAPEA